MAESRLASAVVAALIVWQLVWELWLAPLRPGGSWLALKALPLALLWPGLARGAPRGRTVAALVLLLYFMEGCVRGLTEPGRWAWSAAASAALSTVAFVCLYLAQRSGGKSPR